MCFRRFFVLFAACAALLSMLCTSSAALVEGSSVDFSDYLSISDDAYSFDFEELGAVPVRIISDDPVYDVYAFASSQANGVTITDVPPSNPLFFGSGYITGTDSQLGTVTLYFPINYKSGYWGVDSNGYLYNVNSASMSGYLAGVYNNSVSASGFSYPRYRLNNATGTYQELHLRPLYSNMVIATDMVPSKTSEDLLPYVSIVLLGVIFVCCTRRSLT